MYSIVKDDGEVIATDLSVQQVNRVFEDGQGSGRPIQTAEEKQIEVFLEQNSKPDDIQKLFWMLDHTCALIKITSAPQEYALRLKAENLIRAFILEHRKKLSLLDLEGLEFYTDIQLSRSVTFDNTPNERSQWTMVQSRQRIEQIGGGEGNRLDNTLQYMKNVLGQKGKGGYYG